VAAASTYAAAHGTAQSFAVGPAPATVSITNLPPSAEKGTHFSPTITSSGDGTVFSVTTSTNSVCAVVGSTVDFVGAGNCDLSANVAATTDYLAGSDTSMVSVKSIPKKSNTRISITLSRHVVVAGAEHSLTIVTSVTSPKAGHRLSGSVKTMAGNRLLCIATINAHGVAKCTLAARTLPQGTYSVVAKYEGNPSYNRSTSGTVRLRVT
jgi:hypothetical protein